MKTQRDLDPLQFVLIAVSGWMNQRQLNAIACLREENRILREQLGCRRLRLDDYQRRRLAAKATALGRKVLAEIATIVHAGDLVGLASETYRPEVQLMTTFGCSRGFGPQESCMIHRIRTLGSKLWESVGDQSVVIEKEEQLVLFSRPKPSCLPKVPL